MGATMDLDMLSEAEHLQATESWKVVLNVSDLHLPLPSHSSAWVKPCDSLTLSWDDLLSNLVWFFLQAILPISA